MASPDASVDTVFPVPLKDPCTGPIDLGMELARNRLCTEENFEVRDIALSTIFNVLTIGSAAVFIQ